MKAIAYTSTTTPANKYYFDVIKVTKVYTFLPILVCNTPINY